MMSWCAAENYRPGLAVENYYFYPGLLTLCMSYSHKIKASYVLSLNAHCPGKFKVYCYSLSNLSDTYLKNWGGRSRVSVLTLVVKEVFTSWELSRNHPMIINRMNSFFLHARLSKVVWYVCLSFPLTTLNLSLFFFSLPGHFLESYFSVTIICLILL